MLFYPNHGYKHLLELGLGFWVLGFRIKVKVRVRDRVRGLETRRVQYLERIRPAICVHWVQPRHKMG